MSIMIPTTRNKIKESISRIDLIKDTEFLTITHKHDNGGDRVANVLRPLNNIEVLHCHLNESSGIVIPDTSGNGNNGETVNMGDAAWVPGKMNNALEFVSAGNDYAKFGDICGFERTNPFSVEFWIKTTDTGGFLTAKRDAGGNMRGWNINMGTGQIKFGLTNVSVTSQLYITTITAINDGAWHHVIVTYDGSSTPAGCHIWIDNVNEPLNVITNNLAGTIINTSELNLATRDNSPPSFDGLIDEFVVYDKELTSSEVVMRWNSGFGTEDHVFEGTWGVQSTADFPITFLNSSQTVIDNTSGADMPVKTNIIIPK